MNKKQYKQWEKDSLKEYGFFVHGVFDATDCPNNTNYHTHGVAENFLHPDFQICIGMQQRVFMDLFQQLVKRVKAGEKFSVDKMYSDIANGYDAQFIYAYEANRIVLRLVIPNKENKFEGEHFVDQFQKLSSV